jgi:hypothetical protein
VPPAVRSIVALLLLLEGALTALRVATLLPTLAAYGPLTLTLIALRGTIGAAQFIAAKLLADRRPAAASFVRWALLGSAALVALEQGWRLSPTNLDPTFRWWAVAAYGIYAVAVAVWLRR